MDIEVIIQKLENIINDSGKVPGTQRLILEKIQLDGFLEDLRTSLPGEIREASEILRQRESIISQANLEADRTRNTAQEEAETVRSSAEDESKSLLSDSEVLKQAEKKGEGIINDAQREANNIIQDAQRRAQRTVEEAEKVSENSRSGADQYAREALFNLEERLSDVLTQVRKGLDILDATKSQVK